MTKDEALKLALEAFKKSHICPLLPDDCSEAITAIEKCLANDSLEKKAENARELGLDYEPVAWKLVPVEPTKEMLKAMDECSTEGYDERLYAGHAASVYMAAVDIAPTPPQPWEKFCDSNCVWTDHHPDCKLAEQEPVVWMYQDKSTHEVRFQKHMRDFVDHSKTFEVPLYSEPLANHELQCVCGAVWCGNEMVHLPNKAPPQRKPLTDEEIILIVAECASSHQHTDIHFARAIEAALRSKNT